tara:strand:+ start:3659 stop:4075 length:417 start_codon:yes stop_codon:yes gene_type:complete
MNKMINAYDEREKYKQINVGDELILYQGNVKCLGIVISKNDHWQINTIYRNIIVEIHNRFESGKKVDIPYAHGVYRQTFPAAIFEGSKHDATFVFGSIESTRKDVHDMSLERDINGNSSLQLTHSTLRIENLGATWQA